MRLKDHVAIIAGAAWGGVGAATASRSKRRAACGEKTQS
jgi:hypothetical protein